MKLILIFLIPFILLCGCTTQIAMKDDISVLKEEISVFETSFNNQIQETNTKIEQLQKTQDQHQLIVLNISEEMKNQTRDIKNAIDDISQELTKEIETLKKNQEEKNNQFKQDIDTLKSSQNDLLKTSAALTGSMVNYQKDLLALKTSIQQIATAIDSLDEQKFAKKDELQNLKKDLSLQMQVLLNEIVKHESEIVALKNEINIKHSTQKTAGTHTLSSYYIVQKGDTLSKIAKKYNTTSQKIIELNKLRSERIIIGQKLLIP